MFVPAEPCARLEAFGQLLFRFYCGECHLKRARHERWTRLVGHRESLFFGEIKLAKRGVVADIATRRLRAQPFTNVAFGGACTFGKLRRCLRSAGGEPLVEA